MLLALRGNQTMVEVRHELIQSFPLDKLGDAKFIQLLHKEGIRRRPPLPLNRRASRIIGF